MLTFGANNIAQCLIREGLFQFPTDFSDFAGWLAAFYYGMAFAAKFIPAVIQVLSRCFVCIFAVSCRSSSHNAP